MKKVLFLIELYIVVLVSNCAYAADYFSSGVLTYRKINDSSVAICGYTNGCDNHYSLNISSQVRYGANYYSVIAIDDYAFSGCTDLFGSLTIPNSVTTIGASAFYGCTGLSGSLTIGEAVSFIGGAAFDLCQFSTVNYNATACSDFSFSTSPWNVSELTTLNIGDNVQRIPKFAFYMCSNLTGALTIPASVSFIGFKSFYGCPISILNYYAHDCIIEQPPSGGPFDNIRSLNIGNNVLTIPDGAFYGCEGLTGTLVIPNSVTTIGSDAFCGCKGLTGTLVIPNSVITIGSYAFSGCTRVCSITIPNSVAEIGAKAFFYVKHISYSGSANDSEGNQWGACSINNVFEDGGFLFKNSTKKYLLACCASTVGTLVIPSCVDSIGPKAFVDCDLLTSVTLNNSLKYIGEEAFYRCTGLTGSLVIPNSVTTIGHRAFYGCTGLTGNITIGRSVTFIGVAAFRDCPISTINYNAENCIFDTNVDYSPFASLPSVTAVLNIGDNVLKIPDNAFSSCTGLTGTLVIPNSVTTIGKRAFGGCSGLTGTLVIPNSVTTIGEKAFAGCTGLTGTLVIPDSVTTISDGAFQGCTGFTGSLVIPNSVTRIEFGAFWACTGLSGSLVIPNSVTYIGEYAFTECTGLTGTLVIPNSVTTIGKRAFSECTGLSGSLVIPNSVTYIGEYSFTECTGLTGSLTLSSSLDTIGAGAFSSCTGLTGSLVIPNSVTTIGSYAFSRCTGLAGSLTLSSSLNTIEVGAFNWLHISTVYSLNRVPPRLDRSFDNRIMDSIPIIVPCGSLSAYQTMWSGFSHIQEQYYDIIANSSNPEMGSVNMTYSCPNAEVLATANEGYLFSHWSNGSTANPYSLSLTSDTALVAYFIEDRDFTLTVESNDSSMGYVTGSGEYPYRQDVEISATANTGYIFSHWNDGNTDNPRTIQITSDTIFTAYFVRTYTIIVAVNDSLMGYTTGSGEFLGGQVLEISATANNGYHFSAWQDGCSENPRMVQIISDTIFTAYFEPDTYHIEVSPNNILYGTTTGSGSYNYGENITIAAVANEGYCFRRWQEDGNTQQSRTITVIGDANYTAYFTPNTNHYTITVVSNDPAMGSVSGSGSYLYGTTATIAAYARGRYRFVQWQDGNTQQHREITVTGDSTYTAYFGGNSSDNDDNGIDDILADDVKIYVNGRNIVIEGSLDESVMVYDVMGRTIYHDVVRAPITAPASGVYMVKIGDAKARKVVILR